MKISALIFFLLLTGCNAEAPTDSEPSKTKPTTDEHTTSSPDAGSTDGSEEGAATDAGSEGTMIDACADELQTPLEWFAETNTQNLLGDLELGQTHVIKENETRIHAPLIAQRATVILFEPDTAVAETTDMRISAWKDDVLVGVLALNPPAMLPESLEAAVSSVPLTPYSEGTWSALMPWHWVTEDVKLVLGYAQDGILHQREKVLEGLGAPHRFTLSRSKMVLWGDAEKDTTTLSANKLLLDYFPAIPAAELRIVDALPWILEEFVVKTDDGPLMVNSEAERLAVTNQDHHWALFKHQFALRHSLANTGRGLVMTGESEGDSSPYSFGTSVKMGWFKRSDGNYQDIDDAPWAAGWTGWTAMWADECGNGFVHELGHSLTMAHFTEGTASSWGIADEYLQDGVNLETHPWGYDTVRNRFRTWYRVDGNGPALNTNGEVIGKRDPMNGGENANAASCFPQYTNYHARKAQGFFQNNRTIMDGGEGPGIYQWNEDNASYELSAPDATHQAPAAIDVPVVTLIGTLASNEAATQIYPPIHAISGNLFTLPSPDSTDLPDAYNGGQYVLEIEYTDGSIDKAMIGQTSITDTTLGLFSVNISAERDPIEARLYQSLSSSYPNLVAADLTLVHSRFIDLPASGYEPVLRVGRGQNANAGLHLTDRCEPGFNCTSRQAETRWDMTETQLHFTATQDPIMPPTVCEAADSYTSLSLPIVNDAGDTFDLILHAQRVLRSGTQERVVAITDETPWFASADVQQGLRVWVPWAENTTLPEGHWQNDTPFNIEGHTADGLFSQTPITIDLKVIAQTAIDLATEYKSPGLETPNSSMYFLCTDAAVGATSRVWWGNWDGSTPLTVPVIDEASGAPALLHLIAQQEENGSRWEMHAGRSAGENQHHLVLRVDTNNNDDLTPGRTYITPGSTPLVIEARRWHDPDGQALLETFAFEVMYQP